MSAENRKKITPRRKAFTIEERSAILDRIASGERQISIADEYQVNSSTISSIYRRKQKVLEAKEKLEMRNGSLQMKRFRKTQITPMETKLYKWYTEQKDAGLNVTGDELQYRARQLSKEYGNDTFKGSNGWLHGFKKRWAIKIRPDRPERSKSTERPERKEKKSDDTVSADKFKNELANLINLSDINLDLIYNCGATGLFWKSLPDKTLTGKDERCAARRKQIKERITVMVCTNATGNHKIPLYVIGMSETETCFKNLQTLPVHYGHSENAWMDRYLMKYWYKNIFIPEVKRKHDYENNPIIRILLIMDNALCYPSAEELNGVCDFCTVIFLPPNVQSLIQPLNQGIIEQFKRHYRKLFLSKMYVTNTSDTIGNILGTFNLLHCLKYCASAWTKITPINISNCWKNLVPMETLDNSDVQEDCIDLSVFQSLLSIMPNYSSMTLQETLDYLNIDKDESGWNNASDELIDEDNSTANDSENMSVEEGLKHLNLFIKFYETVEDHSDEILQTLENLSERFINMIIDKAIS